jgi:tellurite resistance protein
MLHEQGGESIMFLNQLSEMEKNAFISLSVHVSNANGVFAEEEKAMIQEYCREMGIPFFDADNSMHMEEIVATFGKSDIRIKKIVLLETLGLAYSDGVYDDSEKSFIKEFAKKIGLTDEDVDKQTIAIKEYLEALKKVAEVIAP